MGLIPRGVELKVEHSVFDGIDTSWSRIKGGATIGKMLRAVAQNFDFNHPEASIPALVQAYDLLLKLDDDHWKPIKLTELKNIISACAGLYLEAVAAEQTAARGTSVNLSIEAINRSGVPMKLQGIEFPEQSRTPINLPLENNIGIKQQHQLNIPKTAQLTAPYWLHEKGSIGMYKVNNPALIGRPETPKELSVRFELIINGVAVQFERPVVYKYNDPVKGEVYQPFEVVPAFTAAVNEDVTIFATKEAKKIAVTVRSSVENGQGVLRLNVPDSWQVAPIEIPFSELHKDAERVMTFTVQPPSFQSEGYIRPVVISDGLNYRARRIDIKYDHIPKQTMIVPSEAEVVRLNIVKKGQRIAYIQGAGDQVPTSLRQIGYSVIELKDDEITVANLQNFDAVVVGIRAYNVDDNAQHYQNELHTYVSQGGTLIVQYNTNRGLKVKEVAPLPLKLSRDRVVEEDAKVTFLSPKHEVLNQPNKMELADFEGWVQERGLYFPNEWSSDYTPILGMHDSGEKQTKGSLLIAKFGQGHFIYTGLSFFRELPAGVPGAYKLFANMVSIGKNSTEDLKN